MMTKTKISIIVAIDERNRGIGHKGQLLWRISDDLQRLKKLTIGHPIIMGRKTYESIGRPLPGRTNIIITRNKDYIPTQPTYTEDKPMAPDTSILLSDSIQSAIDIAGKVTGGNEIFIFGGGEIYKEALPITDRLYLTEVTGKDPTGNIVPNTIVDTVATETPDTIFPEYKDIFKKTTESEERVDQRSGVIYRWLTLERL